MAGTATIGTPNVDKTLTCDDAQKTFSVSLDASGITSPDATITVSYGDDTKDTTVTNNIPQLEVNPLSIDIGFLLPLNLANAATYSVTGDCDSTIIDLVVISMIDEDNTTLTESSSCVSGSFSVELDVSAMGSNSVTISATQGNHESEDHNMDNNIVLLSFNEFIEEFDSPTASAYTLSGKCDYSLEENVEVSVIGVDISDSATCNNDNTFTVDLDGSSLTISTITFQATYGEEIVTSNSIVNWLLQLVRFQSITSKREQSCALTTNGNVKCWGGSSDDPLLLGNGVEDNSSTPVDVHTSFTNTSPLSGIAAISTGGWHTCVLATDDNVKCWGWGFYGVLGDGSTDDRPTPVNVHTSSADNSPLGSIAAISSGGWLTCALTTNGNVKCWGNGRLGNGETNSSPTPVDVHTSFADNSPLSGIAAISTGGHHTCALTTNGNVKCWGYGNNGRLGNDANFDELTPVDVHTNFADNSPLSGIAAISANVEHTCALTTGGNVKCWGRGSYGKLGNDANLDKFTPVDVHTSFEDNSPLSGIEAISAGTNHTCALTTGGNVKCWGRGGDGRLGNNANLDKFTPVDVHTSSTNTSPLSGIAAISASDHTCALTISDRVKCWGEGGDGQLGNGELNNSSTPVDILIP